MMDPLSITHRLQQRLHAAQTLRQHASNGPLAPAAATSAYRLTTSEEAAFRNQYGEPMPHHLRTALHLEQDLWLAVHDTLERATPNEYPSVRAAVCQDLTTLCRLLTLQEEMHHSPLTITFQRRLASLGTTP